VRLTSAFRLAAAAVALLSATGCGSNNKDKIEGTAWSSLAVDLKGKRLPAGWLRLEFGADGRLAYQIESAVHAGTYALGWGDNVALKFDEPLANRKNHTEKIVVAGDRLTMTDSDGAAVEFEKVK
jgi:hypothetical protein